MLKKYRVQQYFTRIVPYSLNKNLTNTDTFIYSRKKKTCITDKLRSTLINFYEDDSVSKMCPGKKDFVVKNKEKKQRRILLDSKSNLYTRFIQEHKIKISYSTFSRARPFWVTAPKKSDRDTCACIKHANMELMVSALKNMNIIKEKNSKEVLEIVTCSVRNELCMLNQCADCKLKDLEFTYKNNFKIKFYQWKRVKEEKLIKGEKKVIQKIIKAKEYKLVSTLIETFKKMLPEFQKHVFYQIHQASQLKALKENLTEGELLFRIDFSENYIAKYSEEIQSAHFGASKRQITLHTGVFYVRYNKKIEAKSFCTVSNNQDHQAHAVWAHMGPILKQTATEYPKTEVVHFYSDGPSSQYRNRINIHLMNITVPRYFSNLNFMTWNYTEAGHGKGPMDGIGGTLKRLADERVSHGADVTCASDFADLFKGSKIHVLEVTDAEVVRVKNEVAKSEIPEIRNITKTHQITWTPEIMYSRSLSCFRCRNTLYCNHYTIWSIFQNYETQGTPDLTSDVVMMDTSPINDVSSHNVSTVNNQFQSEEPSCSGCKQAPRKSVYDVIYTSSEEDDDDPLMIPRTSRDNIKLGTYLLINLKSEQKKSGSHQFVAVCQSKIINDEFEVMFLKNCGNNKALFCANENDVSFVNLSEVVDVLPDPTIVVKGDRIFHKFETPVSIF